MRPQQPKRPVTVLPDLLISKIAAGEVVERPASVVKETVENALDAGASHIRVELEAGGCQEIVVIDNGCGMDAADLETAFERHATSKIATFEELERVPTLGFRGEALAAIASVARVTMTSAVVAGEGTRLVVEGGVRQSTRAVARPQGTTLEVRELFYNVPARRRFLKRPSTEYRRCLEVLQGYALAEPEVHFELFNNGRQALEALPCKSDTGGRLERIRQLFGDRLAEHLMPIPDDALVSGFVGDKETVSGRRIFVFVNGRLLRDRAILAIFYKAVRDLWHSDRFPALFLYLDVPPHEIDVNVHPQKAEIRFRDRAVLAQSGAALRTALEHARGEEPMHLREIPLDSRPAGFAWAGLGRSASEGTVQDGGAYSYREAGSPAGSSAAAPSSGQAALGSVSYQPWQSRGAVLSGRKGESRALRVLGQYKGSLILVEGPDGLYLVDQHAAHERVLYEQFRDELLNDALELQTLLEPRVFELSPAEAELLDSRSRLLERVGFDLSVLSASTVAVKAVPAFLAQDTVEDLLLGLASAVDSEGLNDEDVAVEQIKREFLESQAADKACRSAVKIHQPLSLDKMEDLLRRLFEAEQPYSCPHGRPTVLKLDDGELERRFGRQGWRSGGAVEEL